MKSLWDEIDSSINSVAFYKEIQFFDNPLKKYIICFGIRKEADECENEDVSILSII